VVATRGSAVWPLIALLIVSAAFAPLPRAALGRAAPDSDPDSLYRRALGHLAQTTHEYRQLGLRELDEAVRLSGERIDILHAAARTYSAMGHHGMARRCLDRLARRVPDDAEAQDGLGQLWKWEWLASVDPSAHQKALECLLRCAGLDAKNLECRLAITALALARHNVPLAMIGARSAIASDQGAVETALALGCASYRAGDLARADSAFRAAIPRLPPELRRRFTDLAGVAFDARAPLASEEADRLAEAFWRGSDPDLTTPENEAHLDFLARVAHAVLLFRDRQGVRWDLRAELLARYGIPATVELPHPALNEGISASSTAFTYLAFTPRLRQMGRGTDLTFPYHKQTWIYPELGLRMDLWDQTLDESYGLAVEYDREAVRSPSPELLRARPDLVALDGGRGVYRALPPGVTHLPARGSVATFPTDSGARLVAHLETAGGPADSLWGSWSVVGADGRAAARGQRMLSVSACDPGARRVVQFDAEVPPGDYRVHLAVDDRRGRRGITRLESQVGIPSGRLAMSALLPVCGTSLAAAGGPVWIEPDLDRRLKGSRAITVYFEIDRLALDAEGRSRFAYHYALQRVGADARRGRRADPVIEASRDEENVGAHRRQFVTVPAPSLARGTYDLEVQVRDLGSGDVATRTVRLVKE